MLSKLRALRRGSFRPCGRLAVESQSRCRSAVLRNTETVGDAPVGRVLFFGGQSEPRSNGPESGACCCVAACLFLFVGTVGCCVAFDHVGLDFLVDDQGRERDFDDGFQRCGRWNGAGSCYSSA